MAGRKHHHPEDSSGTHVAGVTKASGMQRNVSRVRCNGEVGGMIDSDNSNAEIAERLDWERENKAQKELLARLRMPAANLLRVIAGAGRSGDAELQACQTVEAYRAIFAFGLNRCRRSRWMPSDRFAISAGVPAFHCP
jgi:hypothetical protein